MGITFSLGVDELWVRDVSLDIDRRGCIIFNFCFDELQVASVEQEMERREKELHSEVVELRSSVENGRLQLARQEKLLAENAREKQDVLERLAGSQENVQDLQEQIGQRDVELKLLQDSKTKLEREVTMKVGYFEETVSELRRVIGLKEEETEALRSERSAERVSRRAELQQQLDEQSRRHADDVTRLKTRLEEIAQAHERDRVARELAAREGDLAETTDRLAAAQQVKRCSLVTRVPQLTWN